MLRLILIGNPGSRRVECFREAIRPYPIDFHRVPWIDVLHFFPNLKRLAGFDSPATVRLESPGRDEEVIRRLIGIGSRGVIDPSTLDMPRGRIVHPQMMFLGFRSVLLQLRTFLTERPHLRCLADPLDLVEMFDKNSTCDRFEMLGVPTPERLSLANPWDAWERIGLSGWPRVFVKLNTGSSASGIVQIRNHGPVYLSGIGSVLHRDGQFFNTRHLVDLEGDDLRAVLDFLTCEGVCIQKAISKREIDGMNFDLRVVMIAHRPRFFVFRVSPNPMTNLHLGGVRGDYTRCRALIPQRNWLDAMDRCVELSESYSAHTIGIDLLFERGSGKPYFLEVNAFGDFFPEWRDESGKTIHEVEIESILKDRD